MTLTEEGDGIVGKRIICVARKVSGPGLIMKGGRHRGLEGLLYDAEACIDVAVEKGLGLPQIPTFMVR